MKLLIRRRRKYESLARGLFSASPGRLLVQAIAGAFLALAAPAPSDCQSGAYMGSTAPGEDREISTCWKIWSGMRSAVTWADLSIPMLGIAGIVEYPDRIRFGRWILDETLSDSIARTDDGKSLGSRIAPDHVGWAIAAGWLAGLAAFDEWGAVVVEVEEYEVVFRYAKALLLNMMVTELTKSVVDRVRPDGSDSRSFFSGHASTTFTYSAFLFRKAGEWIDDRFPGDQFLGKRTVAKTASFAALYGWAAYVGFSRVHDRKHYVADVLAGAAVGTLIGNLCYPASSDRQSTSTVHDSELRIVPVGGSIVGIRILLP